MFPHYSLFFLPSSSLLNVTHVVVISVPFRRSLDPSSRAIVPAVSGLGLLIGAVAMRSLAKLQDGRVLALKAECPACGDEVYSFISVRTPLCPMRLWRCRGSPSPFYPSRPPLRRVRCPQSKTQTRPAPPSPKTTHPAAPGRSWLTRGRRR